MSLAEKLTTVAENQQRVYDAGYEKGKAEGGGGIDYDLFWHNFQGGDGTGRNSYIYAFAYDRFTDETYNPKYPIICSSGTTTAQYMFYNASSITDTKVPIDATSASNLQNTFAQAKALVTVRNLTLKASHTYSNTFTWCTALKNITITGVIGKSISLGDCPLTKDSILSVFNALATDVTGQTVTFKKTALNAAFTTDEWNALKATKTNWTYATA